MIEFYDKLISRRLLPVGIQRILLTKLNFVNNINFENLKIKINKMNKKVSHKFRV